MKLPDDILQQQRDICDKPPRITVERSDDVLAAAREQLAKIAGVASGNRADLENIPVPEMLVTATCHKELFSRLAEVSIQLLKAPSLSLRDRQLVILRTAWLRRIPYIWGEHVRVSKSVGLSTQDIEQVTLGPSSEHWSAYERALLLATAELIDHAMITDDTWALLANTLNQQQLFELPILVGQFSTVGYFQNALRIPLAPGNEGLAAR